jgi:hypothetical protein
MLMRAMGAEEFQVAFSEASLSVEITGSASACLSQATGVVNVSLMAALTGAGFLCWRPSARSASRAGAPVWGVLAVATAYLVTSKVLSPQYLLWIFPLAVVGLLIVEEGPERMWLRRWVVVLIMAMALSHLIFPVLYDSLVRPDGWSTIAVGALVLRNALLVALFAVALIRFSASLRGLRGMASTG